LKVSFDNVHFYEVKLKVDVDKLGGRGGLNTAVRALDTRGA